MLFRNNYVSIVTIPCLLETWPGWSMVSLNPPVVNGQWPLIRSLLSHSGFKELVLNGLKHLIRARPGGGGAAKKRRRVAPPNLP